MCLEVFAGVDERVGVIPFDRTAPAFSVRELVSTEEPIRPLFSKALVYSLGSQSGCGCGFSYDPKDLPQDLLGSDEVPDNTKQFLRDDFSARRETIRRLQHFLASAAEKTGSVEVYCRWIGGETAPESYRAVTTDHFGGEAFRFTEREFLTVVPGTRTETDALRG